MGAEAKGKNWARVFELYQRPLGCEIRDLAIIVGDHVALGHILNRISGTLKSGKRNDAWVRGTICLRKTNGGWLIAHDHVSVPLDMGKGEAMLNLQP